MRARGEDRILAFNIRFRLRYPKKGEEFPPLHILSFFTSQSVGHDARQLNTILYEKSRQAEKQNIGDDSKNVGDFPKNVGDFPKNVGENLKKLRDFFVKIGENFVKTSTSSPCISR